MSGRPRPAITPRRVATVLVGVGLIVTGHFVGGYGGAAVIGAGIGVGAVGVGRREPFLFRGKEETAPEERRDRGRSEW